MKVFKSINANGLVSHHNSVRKALKSNPIIVLQERELNVQTYNSLFTTIYQKTMRTPKKAKCNIHSLSFCNNKHDAPQCAECILVKHRDRKYIYKDGQKYKRCPHCNQYKLLTEYDTNAQGYYGWCRECQREYARMYKRTDKKSFMVGHRVGEKKVHESVKSVSELIKFIRKCINNDERLIEIKRI